MNLVSWILLKFSICFQTVILSNAIYAINAPFSAATNEDQKGSLVFKQVHKCFCLASEVFFEGSCQENVTSIQVLTDEYSSATRTINPNTTESVELGEIVCAANYLGITLPGESFALRTSGDIFYLKYGLSIGHSNYCLEQVYNSDVHEVQTEVHVCLHIPSVPKCCPAELYDVFNEKCCNENNTDVIIPLFVGTNYYETATKSFPNVVNCKGNETKTTTEMSQDNAKTILKLTSEGLVLSYQISDIGEKVTIPSPEYCLQFDKVHQGVWKASYCYEDPIAAHKNKCRGATCLRKCCPSNEIFDMDYFQCTPTTNQKDLWVPRIYNTENLNEYFNRSMNLKIVTGFPINCESFLLQSSNDPPDVFKLLANGTLHVENFEKFILPYDSHQYCIDNFKYGSIITEEAMVCVLEETAKNTECKQVESILYPILLVASCVAIITTLIVYAMIPDLHAKVQGKCLIASISSLIAAYICMIVVQLSSSSLTHLGCITFGLLMQFSLLASFFWLNVMSFDIWKTLGSMKRKSKSGARRRYFLYSLYGWGCPLVVSIVTITMQFLPKTKAHVILPRIGETDCFFPRTDNRIWWVYLHGFISATLIINTLIFIHLAIILFRAKRISEAALGKKNQIHTEWAKLYLKLFLIMGITWIFEIISWIEGSCQLWILTDIINSLRGLMIFVIFVCKKDVMKKLLTKSSPAFHRMRTTMQSSIFSRSSKRTSNFYVDPSSNAGTQEISCHQPPESYPALADVPL